MDGECFARFVRRWTASGSRRGLLRLLAPLAGWLSLLMGDESQAGKGTGGRKGGKRHGRHRPRRRHARRRHHKKNKKKDQPQEQCSPQSPDGLCGANQLCVDGACQDCTVICEGDANECGAALRAAIDAAAAAGERTIYVCPGRYGGGFGITTGVALIGAGDGNDPTTSTIFDAQGGGHVLLIEVGGSGEVVLERLRLTGGGLDAPGRGIFNSVGRTLTMTGCTVSGNSADLNPGLGIGGGIDNLGTLTLNDCRIEGNSAADIGGGIYSSGGITLTGNSQVRGNTAGAQGGGIFVAGSGDLTIDAGCQVTANTAPDGSGGGIYSGGGTVTLDNDQIVTINSGGNCAGADIENCEG